MLDTFYVISLSKNCIQLEIVFANHWAPNYILVNNDVLFFKTSWRQGP